MIQHMNLVFGADGLTVGEGAFLTACCNHTDNRGYVIASMRQIRDEAHLGESAAKANKKKLIARGLLASAERYHPKNGARVADLYRVNIDLLRQMQRKAVDYGPTVVEELTFSAPENPSSTPPSESDGGGSASDGGGSASDPASPSDSDPLLPPSSSPSSLPGGSAATSASQEERESEASPQVPEQRPAVSDPVGTETRASAVGDAFAVAWSQLYGARPLRRQVDTVVADAAEALESGDALEWLADQVAPWMAHRRYLDLARARTHRDCPRPATGRTAGSSARAKYVGSGL